MRIITLPSRLLPALALAALLGAAVAVTHADNTDQTTTGQRYAWGENVGWLNARPSAEAYGPGGSGVQVSDTDVTGYLWGENIGWVNLSCKNNSTCASPAGNWGVKNDGAGHLIGYAWGENVGWVNFSCANDASCGGPAGSWGVTITTPGPYDYLATAGSFMGYAWGENIGWINFNCANHASCASTPFKVQTGWPDSDADGYLDSAEIGLGENQFTYCNIMRADVNGDHSVNIVDLANEAGHFLQAVPPSPSRFDQNADQSVNIVDLAAQASQFLKNVSQCA